MRVPLAPLFGRSVESGQLPERREERIEYARVVHEIGPDYHGGTYKAVRTTTIPGVQPLCSKHESHDSHKCFQSFLFHFFHWLGITKCPISCVGRSICSHAR